jgi:hypothetical protein
VRVNQTSGESDKKSRVPRTFLNLRIFLMCSDPSSRTTMLTFTAFIPTILMIVERQ